MSNDTRIDTNRVGLGQLARIRTNSLKAPLREG